MMFELIGIAVACLGANALLSKNNPDSQVKKNVDTRIMSQVAAQLSREIGKALFK